MRLPFSPSLPAAATTGTPSRRALATAAASTGSLVLSPAVPMDMLITVAPLSTAQVTPAATSVEVPESELSMTSIGITFASRARPEVPMPLPVVDATRPATWVPCSDLSAGAVWATGRHGVVRTRMQRAPGVRPAVRSGWVVSTPWSSRATI